MDEGVEQAAKRRFPHQHLVQRVQKLRKNLLKIWKAKTLKRGKSSGHAIAAGERLQEKINELVTCLFCQGNVELVENLRTWFH